MKKNIALFDFDGTITTKDTFLEFIKYTHGRPSFLMGFSILSPWLVAMKLKLYPNWKAKEKVLTYFFRGFNEQLLREKGLQFCKEKLAELLRPKAIEKLNEHQRKGDKIYIVSASADIWISGWAKQNGFSLIATKLEVSNQKLTGKISGYNCYGQEKVNRIKELENLLEYEHIYAYGDSSGDTQMLNLGHHRFYQYF